MSGVVTITQGAVTINTTSPDVTVTAQSGPRGLTGPQGPAGPRGGDNNFGTRAALVAAIAGGWQGVDGGVYYADTIAYQWLTGAAGIADLPNLVELGFVVESVFQGFANDVNAAIAALANGSVFTLVGVNDTATTGMRLAVKTDQVRLTAETADFKLLIRRGASTNNAKIVMGESTAERWTLGLAGGDDIVETISLDGISVKSVSTRYGATGYVNFASRVGIGAAAPPSFGVHLKGGAGYGGTPPAQDSKQFVHESDGSINDYWMTPNANAVNFFFACAANNDFARIQAFYNANAPYIRFLFSNVETHRVTPYGLRFVKTYTVATVPSAATAGANTLICVTDGTSNKRIAVSDGTNWRWMDGAIVS